MSPKGDPTTQNNPLNPLPNVPDSSDSDPSLSYSSSSDSSDLSDDDYSKQIKHKKVLRINNRVKHVSATLSKSAQSLHPSYLHPCRNQRS